ncbi:MAG: DUF2279 domain-containing protein [Candidatus Brocadiaceae bacterium]|nr:DUF2279 domain-containing protein [Candidatus Brocadiaceae bacterium]
MKKYLSFSSLQARKFLCILLVVITVSETTGCATGNRKDTAWHGKDKLFHFVAAGCIGALGSRIAENNGASKDEAALTGISFALGFGACKELYDAYGKKTFWSWKDVAWDGFGGITGSIAISR